MTQASTAVRPALLVPSLLSADFAALGGDIAAAVAGGADRFQVDVMDGHFVPNLTMGAQFVAATRRHIRLPIEAHLMVSDPGRWVESMVAAGATHVIVHAEATTHLHRVLEQIREAGAHPAVALNPDSSLTLIEEALPQVAMVLLMTVNPGFGGQKFISQVLDKITRLRARLIERGLDCDIEVDGGISAATIGAARRAGANVFVAGSSVYGSAGGPAAALAALRAAL